MFKSIKYFMILFLGFLSFQTNAAVFVLHGSFSANALWWQKDEKFCQSLKNNLTKNYGEIIPFKWSGEASAKARLSASIKLCNSIMENINTSEKIVTIGHSHGGNLILCASQLLAIAKNRAKDERKELIESLIEQLEKIEAKEIIQAKKMFPEIILRFVMSAIKHPKVLFAANVMSEMKKIDQKENHDELVKFATEAIDKMSLNLKDKPLKHRIIDEVYLLGCPSVDRHCYQPSNQIIGQLFNLYSKGDIVQQGFGLYGRTYSKNLCNSKNISVKFRASPKAKWLFYPMHSELHSERIAEWLLRLPALIEDLNNNDFTVTFYTNLYKPKIVGNKKQIASIPMGTEAIAIYRVVKDFGL